jgi:hypothetical protein
MSEPNPEAPHMTVVNESDPITRRRRRELTPEEIASRKQAEDARAVARAFLVRIITPETREYNHPVEPDRVKAAAILLGAYE